jgi:hypothetical protein
MRVHRVSRLNLAVGYVSRGDYEERDDLQILARRRRRHNIGRHMDLNSSMGLPS